MPGKPLLIFPKYLKSVRVPKSTGFGSAHYHYPDFSVQKDRLTPQFKSMQQSFITDIANGLQPEYVLVIETIGQIEDFQTAVRYIEGLEWLAEIDEEEVEPDDIFFQCVKINKTLFQKKIKDINKEQSIYLYNLLEENGFLETIGKGKDKYLTDRNIGEFEQFIIEDLAEYTTEILNTINDEIMTTHKKSLSGRLFLSMSNSQAINKILSLWNSWDSIRKKLPSPYGKWIEIFKQIKTIRKWNIQDRLKDTGIINYWNDEIKLKKGTASKIVFEIELWYRNDEAKRMEAENNIRKMIYEDNGIIVTTCLIKEIRFHAIKAELPPESIEKIINSEYTSVFSCNDIMFFRPVCQCNVNVYPDGAEKEFKSGRVEGEPIIAIFDGVPFSNHNLLKNRLIIDDPDDFESAYQANERKHGTAMASLVCHGELDANEEPLVRPVYFRPIMKPDPDDFVNNPKREIMPKDKFIEDLIERAVHRLFEEEDGEDAVAPTIKVINLSIGDSAKMFFNQLSSGAKLLDWLSCKYNILFCVSAGNINANIKLGKNIDELQELSEDELLKLTISKIHENIRNRKIFSPAESINAITIGSIHADMSTINNIGNRIDILPNNYLPSPFTAHGLGYKNSIKPELYFAGGRQLYTAHSADYTISESGLAPGQCIATSPITGGESNRYVYTRGTSNSTALATRAAAQIYEMLDALMNDNSIDINTNNISVILKALLVHGASWNESRGIIESILKTSDNSKQFKKLLARYIGFGIPDINRVLECTSQRATAIGYGFIKKDDKHDFSFPLPPSISGREIMKRLTITLAWFSPINCASKKYRKANLSIEPPANAVGTKRINADGRQVKNGTIQHEVLEGSDVVSFQDGESIQISVVCREYAEHLEDDVAYGLAVTFEIGENIDLPIYEEIKERINIPIHIKEKI